jgi:hypothetical protein
VEKVEVLGNAFEKASINSSKGMSKLLNSINSIRGMAVFAKGIPYVQIALVALNVINQAFIPKTTHSSYVYGDEKQEFV